MAPPRRHARLAPSLLRVERLDETDSREKIFLIIFFFVRHSSVHPKEAAGFSMRKAVEDMTRVHRSSHASFTADVKGGAGSSSVRVSGRRGGRRRLAPATPSRAFTSVVPVLLTLVTGLFCNSPTLCRAWEEDAYHDVGPSFYGLGLSALEDELFPSPPRRLRAHRHLQGDDRGRLNLLQ